MSFPVNGILDNFNRADGGLGSNWTGPAFGDADQLTIKSNQTTSAASGSGVAFGANYWNVAQFNDCEAYATVPTLPTSGSAVAVYARIDTPGSGSIKGYSFQIRTNTGGNNWQLIRWDVSTHTTIATGQHSFAAGDAIGIACVGSSIQAWVKSSGGSWVQLAAVTDTHYSSAGYIGLEAPDHDTRLDDFGGGGNQVLTLTLSGTSSLAATLAAMPFSVAFAGTSSLVARLSQPHIYATLAGTSTLVSHLDLIRFIATLSGTSTLTVGPYDIGPPGGRISQLALEVATQKTNSEVRLSQVTLEVARARSGLHIWDHS